MKNAKPLVTGRKFVRTWKTWIFNPFLSISSWLDERVFPDKTESQRVQELMEAATLEAEQAAKTIRDHMFTQHMARARIQALENWNHGTNLLCDHATNLPSDQG